MERVKHRSGVWVALYIFYSLFISTPLLTWKRQETLSQGKSYHLRYTLIRSSLNSAGVSSWKGVYHHVMSKHSVTSRQNRYVWRGRSPSVYLALVTLMLSGDIETCPGPIDLRFFYQNTRGISSVGDKLWIFKNYFNQCYVYDIICITETWLHPGINDGFILSDDYHIFRRDRLTTTEGRKMHHGGGVMTAIRKDYRYFACRRRDLETDMEIVWCEVRLEGYSVYVGTVYIPPDTSTDVWDKLAKLDESLQLLYGKINPDRDEIILMGDFNRRDIRWQETPTGIQPFHWTSRKSDNCVGLLVKHRLTQHNARGTHGFHVLDLVWTSDLDCELCYARQAVSSDHWALAGKVRVNSPNESGLYTLTEPNPYMVNCQTLENLWINSFHFFRESPDERPPVFLEKWQAKRDIFTKPGMQQLNYPDWFDRNELTVEEKMCAIQHYARFLPRVPVSPESRIPKVMCFGRCHMTEDLDIAEKFNSFFVGEIKSRHPVNLPTWPGLIPHQLPDIHIDEIKVQDLLISNQFDFVRIIKKIQQCYNTDCFYVELLAKPLCEILNDFLRHGIYPPSLNEELVVPVFDKGQRHMIKSYRPIRLPNAFRDVLEGAVCDEIFDQINKFLLLRPDLRGFVKDIDTQAVCNLAECTDIILSAFDLKLQTDAIYLEMPNAFDTVSHELLMYKLESYYGFSGKLLRLLGSYLKERKQAVLLNGTKSTMQPIRSGVRRESPLGRLLFALFVNDAADSVLRCYPGIHISMYGDVIMLSRTVYPDFGCDELQKGLDEVAKWCEKWQLKLDVPKCSSISFTNNDQPIGHTYYLGERSLRREPEHIKVHGVTLSSNMKFEQHIDLLVQKADKMVDFLNRSRYVFHSPDHFQSAYETLVRPVLEYASPAWSPSAKTQIAKIEQVQKKFVKTLCSLETGIHYSRNKYKSLCDQLNLPTLEWRRKVADLMFLHKCANGSVDSPYLTYRVCQHRPQRHLRYTAPFTLPRWRLKLYKNAFLRRSMKLFNDLTVYYSVLDLSLFDTGNDEKFKDEIITLFRELNK